MKGERRFRARATSCRFIVACALTGFVGSAMAHSGDADIHFGIGGKSVIDPIAASWSPRFGHHIVVDQTSRVLFCYNTSTQGAIEAMDDSGNRDTSFGSGGVLMLDAINDFKVDSKNRIVVVNPDATYDGFNVSRYTSDGMLDKTFGSGGVVDITGDFGGLSGITLQIGRASCRERV